MEDRGVQEKQPLLPGSCSKLGGLVSGTARFGP